MKTRVALIGAVVCISLAARLLWLHGEFNIQEPDELLHAIMAEHFADGATYPCYPYASWYEGHFLFVPPLPLYAAGLVFRVFGASLLSFRAMNVGFGTIGVVAFVALSGLYLRGTARGVAVAVFALSPLVLYESTTAMLGAPSVAFVLVSLWGYVRFWRQRRRGHWWVFALSLGAAAASKQFGLLFGGVVVAHWCGCRWTGDAPPLRQLAAALGVALVAFVCLAPWVLVRPYDSLHFYVYQTLLVQVRDFLRGTRGGAGLLGVPYPELFLAHAGLGALGLAAFLATWRQRRDVLGVYGVLLAVPLCVVREGRYLGLALPAVALFIGYLVQVSDELAARRWPPMRWVNRAAVALVLASLLPPVLVPWRVRSGLDAACRYVASHSQPGERVMANYWRHAVERLTAREMPRDWLDADAQVLIASGRVRYVILDDSPYTRRTLHTPERQRVADWVARSFPLVHRCGGPQGTRVYDTTKPSAGARP
ncbi:MAG: glycosyltransferase family 39 protein [Candidatus Brocadiae bacterium]|nr:glycosyltransferase family 39 protein [Candidatus Brocadiia bacterium]